MAIPVFFYFTRMDILINPENPVIDLCAGVPLSMFKRVYPGILYSFELDGIPLRLLFTIAKQELDTLFCVPVILLVPLK